MVDCRARVGVHLGGLDQPLAAQVLERLLAGDVGQLIAEISTGHDVAGHRLEQALITFEHQHVIDLASGLVDARNHRDQKHLADLFGIPGLVGTEAFGEPDTQTLLSIPRQSVEIIAHRMEGVLVRVLADGVVGSVLTYSTSRPQ